MRILIFGPNGSGKGTQSSRLVKKYGLAHVESGGIFRENIKGGTELGKQAKTFIDEGELVPDSITIPMILDRLGRDDCSGGWILDGFPRNPSQAQALIEGLVKAGTPLDAVIVIEVARETAKARLMGRRNDPNGHPNNTAIPAIRPVERGGKLYCWKCDAELSVRGDDIDEKAIDIRLDIYFDDEKGTLASVKTVEDWAESCREVRVIKVDGEGEIESIFKEILARLG